MEVKINREIRNYTESVFFGLSLRQFIFAILAVAVAVGLYFLLKPYAQPCYDKLEKRKAHSSVYRRVPRCL